MSKVATYQFPLYPDGESVRLMYMKTLTVQGMVCRDVHGALEMLLKFNPERHNKILGDVDRSLLTSSIHLRAPEQRFSACIA